MQHDQRDDLADFRVALLADLEGVAVALLGDPNPQLSTRHALRWGSRGSLALCVRGPKRGLWRDHEAGTGGDLLRLIEHARHCDFPSALKWARQRAGAVQPEPERHRSAPLAPRTIEPSKSPTIDLARRVWREAIDPTNTIVAAYLQSRGLHLEANLPIQFHPECPKGPVEKLPAMIALMTDAASGEPTGIIRTFLAPTGEKVDGVPRMMAGHAGVIRLSPDEDVTTGLGLCEGVETGLAVMQCFDWRPIWACASAGGLRSFSVLNGIEYVTVFADADTAGMTAAIECAERWRAAGREVDILKPPSGDFNDIVEDAT